MHYLLFQKTFPQRRKSQKTAKNIPKISANRRMIRLRVRPRVDQDSTRCALSNGVLKNFAAQNKILRHISGAIYSTKIILWVTELLSTPLDRAHRVLSWSTLDLTWSNSQANRPAVYGNFWNFFSVFQQFFGIFFAKKGSFEKVNSAFDRVRRVLSWPTLV